MGYNTTTDEQFSNDAGRRSDDTPGSISPRRSQQHSGEINVKPLEDHAPPQSCEAGKNGHATAYYVIFVAYAAFMFGVSQKALYELDQKIVPSDDAMTYAIFFFRIVNEVRQGIGSAIDLIIQFSYNWLQDALVLLFSPVVYTERSSLIIINFAAFLFTTILIFRTAVWCKVRPFLAFCCAMLFAGMPWFFDMRMELNLTSLMVDTVYFCAFVSVCIFLARLVSAPYSRRAAIVAGLAVGLTIWSRWNAIITLSFPVAGFGVVAVIRLVFSKKLRFWSFLRSCAIVAAICLAFAGIYFGLEYRPILQYGFNVATSSSFDWPTKIAGAKWLLLNMPGLVIAGHWFYPDTSVTHVYAIVLTIVSHALVIYSAASGVRRVLAERPDQVLLGALGLIGATVFYGNILLAVTTFGGYFAAPGYRELHLLAAALAGAVCSTMSVLYGLLSQYRLPQLRFVNYRVAYVLIAVLVALNSARMVRSSLGASFDEAMWRSPSVTYGLPDVGCPTDYVGCRNGVELPQLYLPSNDLKAFALRLREAAIDKKMYFFWYGLLNEAVMNYYLAQENLSPLVAVRERTPFDHSVWLGTFTPKDIVSETWFRDWLKYILAKADFIVIPEKADAFADIWSSPIVAYHDDIVAAINSPQIAPDYVVWGIIEEPDTRVLVLKKRRAGDADDGLEAFPRTWGKPTQVIGRDFKGARIVAARMRRPIDPPSAEPVLVKRYKGYNIVHFEQLYVGVDNEVGAIDVAAVLANKAPRPPSAQFLLANSTVSLEAAIDRVAPNPAVRILHRLRHALGKLAALAHLTQTK